MMMMGSNGDDLRLFKIELRSPFRLNFGSRILQLFVIDLSFDFYYYFFASFSLFCKNEFCFVMHNNKNLFFETERLGIAQITTDVT